MTSRSDPDKRWHTPCRSWHRRCHSTDRSEERRVGKECRSRGWTNQAEDGIRDIGVTGVQTCALPIYSAGQAGHGAVLTSGWVQPAGWSIIEMDLVNGKWKINDFTFGSRQEMAHAMQVVAPTVPFHG